MDPSTGLVVTGLEADGLWHDAVAGATYTLSRSYSSPKLLLGVNVNGAFVDFNAHEDGWVYEGTVPASGGVEISSVYAAINDWYVDAANGSDANDGLRPGAAHAFKTLAHASTNALMEAGATVYVAEGLYNSGVVPASLYGVDATDNRMVVRYKINFVASGRREYTIVEGASSTDTESGIGDGAVRCCLMRGGSLRGFTLRNGNVKVGSSVEDDKGGGIRSSSSDSYAYDCEIHHCNAVRGGGAQGVRLVRCYLHDNTNDKTGVPDRSIAGTGAFGCSGYNTVVEGDCYTGATWLNCTLTGRCWGSGTTFYNCYIGEDGSAGSGVAATFTNCVCATAFKSHSPHAGCIENKPCRFDASSWRPKSHLAAVVNAGDGSLYVSKFPADLTAYAGLDYAGGERVLDDRIDVGAGEIIWKPTGMIMSFR